METTREIDDLPEMIKAASDIREQSRAFSMKNDWTVTPFEAMQIACLMEANRVRREVADRLAEKLQVIANVIEGT